MFKSTDGGANWRPFHPSAPNTGFPTLTIDALAVDPILPTTIYAATTGGGVFDIEQESTGPPPTSTPGTSGCVGDCSGDGEVTVNELLVMVNVALGNTALTACRAGDGNHDNKITIDEILTAVTHALNGCRGS